MKRRFRHRWVLVLVAAQLLCAPPVVEAFVAMANSVADQAHCGGHMPAVPGPEECPCCPPGDSMASCLTACATPLGSLPAPDATLPSAGLDRVLAEPVTPLGTASSPPLDPPPIGSSK